MSVNVVMLKGRIGKLYEIRYLPSGAAVLNFTLATSESWTDKSGAKKERTTWHRCQAWEKQAEILTQYAVVGQELFLQGKLENHEYEKKEGGKQQDVVVRVEKFDFGPKPKGAQEKPTRGNEAPAEPTQQQGGFEDPDEIPF